MPNTSCDEEWDLVVIGAGPAGSAAAICAARDGLKVLLVDSKRFPRRKVCGGCLNQVSSRLVKQLLGGQHPVWDSALPLDSFQLTHRGRHFSFAMPSGLAIDRALLDQSLVEMAQQTGVTFLSQVSAKLLPSHHAIHPPSTHRDVELTQSNGVSRVRATVVVLACGLGNRSAAHEDEFRYAAKSTSRVGIEAIFARYPTQYSRGAIHMVVGRHGYVGLTQISGQRLHVAAAVARAALQDCGPAELCQAILREAGAPPMLDDPTASWRGTPPLTARSGRLAAERVFLVGDAASYVEPFTGEGIRWALETGMGVAPLVAKAKIDWQPQLVDQWEGWYRQRIEPEQRLCRRIANGLKQFPVRWISHQALRLQPRLADLVIARLNRES
jgi:flavin-dependent dehydrogenase